MDLPAPIRKFLDGGIDPYSQTLSEAYANYYLAALVAVSFLASFVTSSVFVAIEIFGGGFLLLLLTCVPPWPFLNKYKVRFLPVRSKTSKKN